MSSSFSNAVCGAAVVLGLVAGDAGSAEVDKTQIAGIRQQLDVARNRVWLLTGEGVAIYDAAAPARIQRVPLPGWRFVGEPYGCLPDLALGPKGEAVISSDVVPEVWRVDPETLAVTRHELLLDTDSDKDVGFTVVTYSPAQGAFLAVSGLHGSAWRIDGQLRQAQKMAHQAPREKGCGARLPF